MARFAVYQQLTPLKVSESEYVATLPRVGEVEARNTREAIELARKWSRFQVFGRRGLGGFPVVENLDQPRGESEP